jgi:hypothetical protein
LDWEEEQSGKIGSLESYDEADDLLLCAVLIKKKIRLILKKTPNNK